MREEQPLVVLKSKSSRLQYLVYLGLLLIVCNTFSLLFFSVQESRVTRLLSSACIILYYLFLLPKNKLLTIALVAFVFRDFFSIMYEGKIGIYGYFISGFIAYSILVFKQLRNLIPYRFEYPSLISVLFFAGLSFLILFTLESFREDYFNASFTSFLFYSMGSSVIFLLFMAVYYYYRLGSLRSLIFSFSVAALAISDILTCISYYADAYNLVLIIRVFYFGGLILLINYGVNSKLREKETMPEDLY